MQKHFIANIFRALLQTPEISGPLFAIKSWVDPIEKDINIPAGTRLKFNLVDSTLNLTLNVTLNLDIVPAGLILTGKLKFVIIFSRPPLQGSKIVRAHLLYQGP